MPFITLAGQWPHGAVEERHWSVESKEFPWDVEQGIKLGILSCCILESRVESSGQDVAIRGVCYDQGRGGHRTRMNGVIGRMTWAGTWYDASGKLC
jgi:hypothetical protein